MADTILRQWQMLRLVPRQPRKVCTSDLQKRLLDEGFGIDQRTIQRDLQKLSVYYPLVCDDRSTPYGWSWSKDADLFDVPGMDVHVALSFQLAAEHLKRLLPAAARKHLEPHFERASRVLDELDGRGLTAWIDKVRVVPSGLRRQPPHVDPDVLDAVQTALLDERKLQLRYRRRGATEARSYDVSPLALVHRDALAYLVGTARDYSEPRQFALHRIEAAEVLTELPNPCPGFDLDDFLRQGAMDFQLGDEQLQLQAAFAPEVTPSLLECPLSDDQTTRTTPDGRLLLTATVANTNELRVWLRGFGRHAEVLEPAFLRKELAEEARATAALYD